MAWQKLNHKRKMETINPIIYIYIVEEKKHKFYNIYEMFKIQFLRDKR